MKNLKKILDNKYIKKLKDFTGYIFNLNTLNRYILIFSVGIVGNFFYNLEYKWNINVKYNPVRDIKKIYESQKEIIEAIKSIDLKALKIDLFTDSHLYIIPSIFFVLVLSYIFIHRKNLGLWTIFKKTVSFILGALLINALVKINWNNFIFYIKVDILIPLVLLFIEFIGKAFFKKSDNEKIYENRVVELENFQRILEEKDTKKLVLIDGSWGTGKSFFVDTALNKKTLFNYHKINLDVLLFNDKKQIISQTMNEINLILEKEGIRDSSAKKYARIINYVSSKYSLSLNFLKQEKSLDEVEVNLESDLKKLKNPIIIIVENLERTLERNTVIDTLGFLHKIYSLGNNNMKIVLLADTSKINDLEGMKDYLDKFFDISITLGSIGFKEILESVDFSGNSIIKKENFIEAFEESLNILEVMNTTKEYSESFKKMISSYSLEISNCLSNSRNILKIVEESRLVRAKYDNYFSDTDSFNENIYQKLIIIIQTYKYIIGIPRNLDFNYSNYELFIKQDKKLIETKMNYFYEFISLSREFRASQKINDRLILFNSLGRIIEGKTESKEKKIIKKISAYKILFEKEKRIEKIDVMNLMTLILNFKLWIWIKYKLSLRNNWIQNIQFESFLKDYDYYIKYLDKENLKDYIYSEIFNQIERAIRAKEIKVSTILELLKSEEFLSVDKNCEEKNRKSIFDFLPSVNDYDGMIQNQLFKIYTNEFILFSYKYLDLDENIVYISESKVLDDFIDQFCKKYTSCEKAINKILQYIVDNISDVDIKLKEEFNTLLKKINKLETGFSHDEEINFSLIDEIKEEVKTYPPNVDKKEISILKKWIEKSKLIEELLMKSLREELYVKLRDSGSYKNLSEKYVDYYNEKLEELVSLVPKDFYKSIIVSLSNFNDTSRKLLLTINVMDKLLDGKVNNFLNQIETLLNDRNQNLDRVQGLIQISNEFENEMSRSYFNVIHPIRELDSNVYKKVKERYEISSKKKLSDDKILELIKELENEEFKEIDETAEQKHVNPENKRLFRDAIKRLKEQYRILLEKDLYYSLQLNKEDKIDEEIKFFFNQFNSFTDSLWQLIHVSISYYWNQLPMNKFNYFGEFLDRYQKERMK